MLLKSINIQGFRNLKSIKIDWSAQCNVLLGKNGQGKTSLLEAIYFLGSGKSFRTATNSEIIAFSSEQAKISGQVISSQLALNSELAAEINRKSKTRFFIHQKEAKLANGFLGKFIVVAFVPGDTEIVRGSPSERRRFLDKHLVDIYPSHLVSLLRYQKALKSKLALLAGGSHSAEALDPWDWILAESGAQITATREKFISELDEHMSAILPLVAPKDGTISLALKKTGFEDRESEVSTQTYFDAILAVRKREIASERALLGPHRDDLLLSLSGRQAREFSSQGQARTLTLLLKLTVIELIEIKTGESPAILLDDVDSELDEGRARFLFNVFAEKGRQIFISSTTNSDLWPKEAKVFSVSDGEVTS